VRTGYTLVEEIGALRDFVLDNLHMGSQEALFNMGFWMCSIVDIRMVSSVSSRCTAKRCMDSATKIRSGSLSRAKTHPRPVAVGSGNLPKRSRTWAFLEAVHWRLWC
jgi:hypothetical protein